MTKAKRAGGVAQELECLLSKHSALNSNPSINKTKQKTGPYIERETD
jgi:hypothetical protein